MKSKNTGVGHMSFSADRTGSCRADEKERNTLAVRVLHPASYGKIGVPLLILPYGWKKGGIFMNSPISARTKIYRIAIDAMFIAVYVILGAYLSIKIPGVIQISLSSLPVLLCAFLFRPSDAIAVAVIGNFLEQVLDPSPYGFATLLIWLIPGALQALIASLGARTERQADSKRKATVLMLITIVCAELTLTLVTTGAIYLDGYLLHYPVKALHIIMPSRLLNCLGRSILSCILLPLIVPPLRRVLTRWQPYNRSFKE